MSDFHARSFAERMAAGLSCIPNKARGDLDEVLRLRAVLEQIRDTAYSPRDDDWIWMDDQTPLGQFIDRELQKEAANV